MESNLKPAQEEELRVLSSIYTNALKDLRSRRDKRLRSPHFSLTIVPLRSNSTVTEQNNDPTFDLVVKETPLYPHELPEIALTNPKNLPNESLQECEKELREVMKENLGKEMIFEIAQHARAFLEAYRPIKRTSYPIPQAGIDAVPDNDEQLIEREINALREKHLEEEKTKRRGQSDISANQQVKLSRIISETILHFENPISITIRRGHILHKDVHPTLPGQVSNISYICTDTDSAHVYCLYEWNFISAYDEEQINNKEDLFAKYREEFGSVERDLQSLVHLRHSLLCKTIAYQCTIQENTTYIFRVLTEWPEASSLEVFDSCPVSEALLKRIAISLCDVLAFLHSKSMVHRAINSKSIFLLPNGIKLARTSFVRRLNDLHALFCEGQLPHSVQGSPKNDIYDMGLLLLNLATGRTHDYILDAPSSLSEEFQDFLQQCANGKSLDQLVMNPFLLHTSPSQTNFDRLISDNDDRETVSSHSNNEEMLLSAQSRLKSDFEVIGVLGRGGFGDVFKVQNKLDSCFYAVKRIPLKSANKSVNKKITREVKLLSKLNHQNIVRYYSTWTEQIPINDQRKSPAKISTTSSPIPVKKKLTNGDSLRHQLPGTIPDLSSSNEFLGNPTDSSESSSSSTPSSDDEDGVFDTRNYSHIDDSDDMIEFDRECNQGEKSEAAESKKKLEASSSSSSVNSNGVEPIQRALFIQMEYCEGNTLKQLIERRILQEKPSMIWMLLREILEGLKHMHQKGIIHRDLKPGNILLDSTGHAKIGDLGLATISTLSGYTDTSNGPQEQHDPRSSWSIDMKDGGLVSTPVGTTFYMAPELLSGKRIAPTEKVDIYSLGITFFEMCYPFNTLMERAKMLCEIRRSEIHVPDRFRQKSFSRHYALMTQMLTHDPDKRPTANTLLESNIIPFEQEEKFEQLLDHMINSTNNDIQSFYYRRTIAKLFQRKNSIARDATFDPDTQIDFNKLTTFHRDAQIYNTLRNSFTRIFEKYGAFYIQLPTLLPAPDIYNKNECANLKFISSTGLIVSLPFDSKVPLARFIARCVSHYGLNGLTTMKCYQIGNVYRERVSEMHPRELIECDFDIIFTQPTYFPDAEILAVCQDVVNELHLQNERKVFVRLNHTELLRAILIYFEVPQEKIAPILSAIHTDRFDATDSSIALHLIEHGINETTANRIQTLLNKDGSFEDVINHLKGFTKGQTEKSKFLKSVLDELEIIVKYARAFGVTMPISMTLRFFTLNPVLGVNTFSGVIFQLASMVQRKRRSIYEVYAGGGRYDPLLAQFRRPSQKTLSNELPHIVGVSFDVERLIQLSNNRTSSPNATLTTVKACDTVICLGNYTMELLNLRQKLVALGIGVDMIYDLPSNLAVLDDYCVACGYNHLIYRKDDATDESFRLRTYENGKAVADKRLFTTQIIQSYRPDSGNATLINSSSGSMLSGSYSDIDQPLAQPTVGTPGVVSMKNAPSMPFPNSNNESVSAGAQLNIYLYLTEAMFRSIPKRRVEIQVQYKLSSLSSFFTSKSRIEVFVFDLSDSLLTTIISTLSIEDENQFDASLRSILEKPSTRSHDIIHRFGDHMRELRFIKKSKLFVISSYKTDFYRFMAAFT